MVVIDKLKEFIKNLDEKDFYKYLIGFGVTFLLLIGITIYWHRSRVDHWKKQLSDLKKQRVQTKKLLNEYNLVELDRQKVNNILSSEANFKIRGYYNSLISELGLAQFITKEPEEPQTTQLESGEKERTLTADFHDLTMKQVTDILGHIENNSRVYTKKITIDKISKDRPTLNVTLEIATIEPSTQNLE